LWTCSGCLCAQYCNEGCQRKARSKHKEFCVLIKKQLAVVDAARKAVLDHYGTEQEFESRVGDLRGWARARPYLRARLELAKLYFRMAEHDDDPRGRVLAKEDHAKLVRLTQDNPYIRCIYPFVLLELGELQEAFDFIKYWEAAGRDVAKVKPLSKTKELLRYPHAEGIFDNLLERETNPAGGYRLEVWIFLAAQLIKFMLSKELKDGGPDSEFVKKVLAAGKSPKDVSKRQFFFFSL
jgi:hypothetical protein